MPRNARVVIAGCPHHITQRGNNGQDVFFSDADRRMYLDLLAEQCEKFSLAIEGYCLMTNHIHLIATPKRAGSLAKAVGRTNLYYTRYINSLQGRSGHLWQDRFFSCPLEGLYYWAAMIYVDRNPVRAGMVRKPWRWEWSSAAVHCGGKEPITPGLIDLDAWNARQPTDGNWSESISHRQDEEMLSSLRAWSNRGCPLGSDKFITKLERKLKRRLRPGKRGRPKIKKKVVKNGNRPD